MAKYDIAKKKKKKMEVYLRYFLKEAIRSIDSKAMKDKE